MREIHQTIIDNPTKLDDFRKCLANDEEYKWIYRGEKYKDVENSLKTSLEMAFGSINPSIKGEELDKHKINAEKDIIREFQRKLHLYSDNLPTRADIIQWLSLMQHHGAPTRLLDWTYSFWVAVHFAISRCVPETEVAIWAINIKDIVEKGEEFKEDSAVEQLAEDMEKEHNLPYCDRDAIWDNAIVHHLIEAPKSMVYISSSFRRNERLTLQQGTFIITGDITKSFKENLQDVTPWDNENYVRIGIIKVTSSLKKEIVKKLLEMNINNAVLFPGLDGFSQSLWSRVPLRMEEKLLLKSKNLTLYP